MYLTADSMVTRYSFQLSQLLVCCWSWLRAPLPLRKDLNLRDFSGFRPCVDAIYALLAMLHKIDSLTLEHGTEVYVETSVSNYQYKLHNIPEEGISRTPICPNLCEVFIKNQILIAQSTFKISTPNIISFLYLAKQQQQSILIAGNKRNRPIISTLNP